MLLILAFHGLCPSPSESNFDLCVCALIYTAIRRIRLPRRKPSFVVHSLFRTGGKFRRGLCAIEERERLAHVCTSKACRSKHSASLLKKRKCVCFFFSFFLFFFFSCLCLSSLYLLLLACIHVHYHHHHHRTYSTTTASPRPLNFPTWRPIHRSRRRRHQR